MLVDRLALVRGDVYRLRSRNLAYGVYDGTGGFIGIREKFGLRYLDREYLGRTAVATERVGKIEEPIELVETLGSVCTGCGEGMDYRAWEAGEVGNGYLGRWVYIDEGEGCGELNAIAVANEALFHALEVFEDAGSGGVEASTKIPA